MRTTPTLILLTIFCVVTVAFSGCACCVTNPVPGPAATSSVHGSLPADTGTGSASVKPGPGPLSESPVSGPTFASSVPGQSSGTDGQISGMVLDKNLNGVPGATVKLWETSYDPSTGQYHNVGLVSIAENPQLSNSNSYIEAPGTYSFQNVPDGVYNITGEKSETVGFAIIHVNSAYQGTITANIVLADYSASQA